MSKLDHKKLDCYRAPSGGFRVVDVPPLQYLMIDGHGDPNTSASFREAVAALFPLAYKLKFASKLELGRDYVVMPLEGLWWADDMDSFTAARDKSRWDFTLLVMQPEWITPAMVRAAVDMIAAKDPPTRLNDVRLETLDKLHREFIPAHGMTMAGKHHEIYFSDFRKVAPEKLRTILRQPVRPV